MFSLTLFVLAKTPFLSHFCGSCGEREKMYFFGCMVKANLKTVEFGVSLRLFVYASDIHA